MPSPAPAPTLRGWIVGIARMSRVILASLSIALAAASGGADTPASTGEPSFRKGVSIAHWLAKVYDPAGPGGAFFGRDDVQWIARSGFDHVRIPVDGRWIWRTDGTLDEERLAPLVHALAWSREAGLGVVIDMHFLPGGVFDRDNQDPAIFTQGKAADKAALFWARFAARFRNEGRYVRFELINEPFAPDSSDLNRLNRRLMAAVRSVDSDRFLYITSNLSSTFDTLAGVEVPSDPRVGIVLHYDEPEVFTHQRASWKHCPADMPQVEFPGTVPDLRSLFPPEHFAYKASLTVLSARDIDAAFDRAQAWLAVHAPGKPVYLGEFGAYEAAPGPSRRRYIRAVRQAAESHGWGWAVWSYNGSFTVRDKQGQATPVLEGLFEKTP